MPLIVFQWFCHLRPSLTPSLFKLLTWVFFQDAYVIKFADNCLDAQEEYKLGTEITVEQGEIKAMKHENEIGDMIEEREATEKKDENKAARKDPEREEKEN